MYNYSEKGGGIKKSSISHMLNLSGFGLKGFRECVYSCVFLDRLGAQDGEEMKGGKREVGGAEDLN